MNFTDSPYERMMKQIPRPSRHDRLLREMPLEERFVGRDVLYAYDIVPANLDNLVNQ